MSEEEIYDKALEKFGMEAQILMCIEEMSELTKELCKNDRGVENSLKIAEELADVEIMLEQIALIFKVGKLVVIFKQEKLAKLSRLIGVENDRV